MFDWYKLFSLTEFLATGLTSRTVTAVLEGVGQVDVLVTKGVLTSILYDGTFLPIQFMDENPYSRDGYAVYKDAEENVWLGIEVEA